MIRLRNRTVRESEGYEVRAGDNDKLNKLDWLRWLGRDVKDFLAATFYLSKKTGSNEFKTNLTSIN